MRKQGWRGSTLLNPEPPVLVSCGGLDKPNLITIGWTGTICTQPSMVSISVRPERFSHHLIRESGQFAINLPTEALVRSVDWCGVKSGRDVDKFAACGLHAAPGTVLTDCPILEESPVNLECRVTQVIPLGSHDLFLAEVVACDVDERLLDENGKLCLDKARLIVYSHGEYLSLGKKLGTFGYSVRKKKTRRLQGFSFLFRRCRIICPSQQIISADLIIICQFQNCPRGNLPYALFIAPVDIAVHIQISRNLELSFVMVLAQIYQTTKIHDITSRRCYQLVASS